MRAPSTLFAAASLTAAASVVQNEGSAAAVLAFSTTPPSRRYPRIPASRLGLAPIGGGPELADQIVSAQHAADLLHAHVASVSTILSDAAAAAADVSPVDIDASDVVEAAKEGGWWKSYLSFFQAGLENVHSTIDPPLRSIGVEQTWGPSIAIFTAGVRSLLIPLSVQQSKQSEYTKALKPYQDEIKEKFKDRKELQNRATAKLYEDAGTNPLTGCLISLSQIPIFLGLYRGITLLAKDGKLQEPFLWIPSLEGPVSAPTYRGMEWLTQGWTFPEGGIPTPGMGWETTLAFCVMPVVLVIGQAVTMKSLTPEPDDRMSDEDKEQFEKSQGFLKFLPLLIGYFSLQVPAGLTIYWLTSNAFTLTQSLAVRAYYKANPPEIELPDYWDALDDVSKMSPEKRRAAAEAGINAGPKMEDLLDEAKFHFVVKREPLRVGSPAWERVQGSGAKVPDELSSWVSGPSTPFFLDVGAESKEPETKETAKV